MKIDKEAIATPCPICACPYTNTIAVKTVQEVMFRVLQCLNVDCLHGFVTPLPTLELLEHIYAHDNLNDYLVEETKEQNAARFFQHLFEHYIRRGSAKPGSLLDVGAGTGTFVRVALQCGWDASGIEFNEKSTVVAMEKYDLRLVRGSFYTLERYFAPRSFDLINMNHVYEHILEPISFLRYVTEFLRPGGCVLVTVPNILSDDCRRDGALWSFIHIPAHVSYFSRFSMDAIFERRVSLPGSHFEKIFQSSFPSPPQDEGEGLTSMFRLVADGT